MGAVNEILLRRKNKLLVPASSTPVCSRRLIAAFNLNIQSLGYTLSPRLIKALERASETTATRILEEALSTLKALKGAHAYRPFYPNFPQQVMEAEECELYFNAMLHYWSFQVVDQTGDPGMIWFPKYDKVKRAKLDEKIQLRVIDLATEAEAEELATQIATSNTSISQTDKDDLRQLAKRFYLTFPKLVPNKENLAFIGALFIDSDVDLAAHFRTATDILRLATALSDGDVSLSEDSKFRSFKRGERRLLLGLLDKCAVLEEDMLRWEMRWKRLGERLHPGEYAKRFKNAYRAFHALRNEKITTIRTHIEAAIRAGNITKSVKLLTERPGDFARRLDHLLRQADKNEGKRLRIANGLGVVRSFAKVAHEVSTPVLLQTLNHFEHRDDLRVVFPKGNVAKVMSLETTLPPLPEVVIKEVVTTIEKTLIARFAKLPKLGKVYVDKKLRECLVPFSQRSASKALRTLVRGSKLDFGHSKDTVRFFIWWKEPKDDRTDLDLSAVMYNKDWKQVDTISYWSLRGKGGLGYHSGDITSAPNGASEFIDISIPRAIQMGARYITMSVNAYSSQNFCDLPECTAGWMLRSEPQSGEIYDPRTVSDKIDLSMEARAGVPLILDLVERKIIWADAAITPGHGLNNVHSNRGTMELLGKALTSVNKPNLYDLFAFHAEARGKLVVNPDKADVVFSVAAGTPFELEKIASEFLSDAKLPLKAKAAKK